jgi:hypothetical protein
MLLGCTARAVRRHVVLGRPETDVVVLWALAVHGFDAWLIFPRLLVTAPRAARHFLARRRRPDREKAWAKLAIIPLRFAPDFSTALDAGHRHDGAMIRTVGEDHELRQFSVWSPVALAAIRRLAGVGVAG